MLSYRPAKRWSCTCPATVIDIRRVTRTQPEYLLQFVMTSRSLVLQWVLAARATSKSPENNVILVEILIANWKPYAQKPKWNTTTLSLDFTTHVHVWAVSNYTRKFVISSNTYMRLLFDHLTRRYFVAGGNALDCFIFQWLGIIIFSPDESIIWTKHGNILHV